ncbi:DNA-binding protein [Caballeronia sordidicola]|uniref:KfrA protein n=1 Tax=Caballeronia sordidicola TaxID=196367 RepID=A0A226XBJ6_CABSO|nr:DNA-binding protein [Caballeronia sordidicola]OXC80489.1 KfrA protein [Caballeronia sordidicola]
MTPSTPDARIDAEIAQLRAQFPRTQELYREVCVLLFFRYGVTPTANKLYQLVKKGSMSAPAEALTAFWATLREKSRVRIQSPDLPEELQTALGELAATVWDRAQLSANEALAGLREEAAQSAAHARGAQALAEAESEHLRQELIGSAAALDAAHAIAEELQQTVAVGRAAEESLKSQLKQLREEQSASHQALEDARQAFTTALEKQRAAGQLAEERLRATEARALLEIDRERVAATRAQKGLDDAQRKLERADERHRAELTGLQAQVSALHHQAGVLEGNRHALEIAQKASSQQIAELRRELHVALKATTEAPKKRVTPANTKRGDLSEKKTASKRKGS